MLMKFIQILVQLERERDLLLIAEMSSSQYFMDDHEDGKKVVQLQMIRVVCRKPQDLTRVN